MLMEIDFSRVFIGVMSGFTLVMTIVLVVII